MSRHIYRGVCLSLVAALFVLGCTSDDDGEASPSAPSAAVTATPSPTPTTEVSTPTVAPRATPMTSPGPAEPAAWTHYGVGDAGDRRTVLQIDVNPDGTTWALLASGIGGDQVTYEALRFQDDQWVGFDGLQLTEKRPFAGWFGYTHPVLAAGIDGNAWILDIREPQTEPEEAVLVGDLWEFDGRSWIENESGTRPYGMIDVGGDGVLWAAYAQDYRPMILRSYEGESWAEQPDFPSSTTSFHVDAQGQVWARGSSGVMRLDGGGWEVHAYLLPAGDEEGWIAPEDGYVVAPDGTMWAVLGRGDRYADAELLTETFDGEAWSVWPADTSSAAWTEASALALSSWWRLAALGDEHLFVSREAQLIWFDVAGVAQVIPIDGGAGNGDVTALAADSEDTIWIGKGGVLTRFTPASYEASSG